MERKPVLQDESQVAGGAFRSLLRGCGKKFFLVDGESGKVNSHRVQTKLRIRMGENSD